MQSYLTCIICFSELKHLFATVKRHSVGVFPCFATTFFQLAYFLLRPRHSIAMAEQDYPEILLERTEDRTGYSGCLAVMSRRREELKTNDPRNIKPSWRKPIRRDYFFLADTQACSEIISNTIVTSRWQFFQLSNLFR